MVVTDHGYIGLAKLAGDRVSVAAAIDAAELAEQPPGELACRWLREAGYRVSENLAGSMWHGTPPLTNRPRRVAAERLFLIGDAGGYVEPFTGEGIAAALESAAAVVPLVATASPAGTVRSRTNGKSPIGASSATSNGRSAPLAWMLRRPAAAGAVLAVGGTFPVAARFVISKINQAPGAVTFRDEAPMTFSDCRTGHGRSPRVGDAGRRRAASGRRVESGRSACRDGGALYNRSGVKKRHSVVLASSTNGQPARPIVLPRRARADVSGTDHRRADAAL